MTVATNEIYGTTDTNIYGDVAVSVQKTRIIYRCGNKACKHTWAHEYRKIFTKMAETIYPRNAMPVRYPAKFNFYRFVAGKLVRYENDTNCPKCGRHGTPNVVVGTLNEAHKCDARCTSAKGGDCECACGGANHGINHL